MLIVACSLLLGAVTLTSENLVSDAQTYLDAYNDNASLVFNDYVTAEWRYWLNETDENKQLFVKATVAQSAFNVRQSSKAALYDVDGITDASMKRQLHIIHNVGQILSNADAGQLSNLINEMTNFYDAGQVCNYTLHKEGTCAKYPKTDESAWWLSDPEITETMAKSRDYDELEYLWLNWRDVTGTHQLPLYKEYIELMNKGSRAAGFSDAGAWWRAAYEDDTFENQLEDLWKQVLPLYEEMHTYIRRKMIQKYPGRFEGPTIPAHLFGNMWAQEWNNILDFTVPYPNETSVDVTPEMIKQDYNASHMFHLADSFFASLGIDHVPDTFWNVSMITRPTDGRTVDCYADSETFYNQKDFGIKMCTKVTMEDLITIHHELGHIHYFMAYAPQPIPFRNGANPGFHEAIGDTMALSASTQTHLQKIGLLSGYTPGNGHSKSDINFLFSTALSKIAFLPFGYLIDHYRWKVFDGTIKPDELNAGWWALRHKYQGIVPPDGMNRAQENDKYFDAGSKFHVANNVPYIRYFVSFVIQFQFYDALCKAANHTGPLHQCDFYQSTDAGDKLLSMLDLGYSEQWPNAMEVMTGQRVMDASGILSYFKPLMDYLKKENADAADCYGWGYDWPNSEELPQPRCVVSSGDNVVADAQMYLSNYNMEASTVYTENVIAELRFGMNETDYNSDLFTKATVVQSNFDVAQSHKAAAYDVQALTDPGMKRQVGIIHNVGQILSAGDTKQLQTLVNNMTHFYSAGEVCDYSVYKQHKCDDYPKTDQNVWLVTDPNITELVATSRDYDELEYLWLQWRDVTGKNQLPLYKEYIELMNKGSKAAGFDDAGAWWRAAYEDSTFENQLEELWMQVLPLYEQLHAYVRRKLQVEYPNRFNGPAIPAHIFGNMWAQEWNNILDITVPHPDEPSVDVTAEMVKQGYNASHMFHLADSFFTSLGIPHVPESFWELSMITRPTDGRVVDCYASSSDYYNGKDFAIKMCTKVTMEDLITIHHELGHIHYFMAYAPQPIPFRNGANPGFHEAIGDTMALSASTQTHLQKIGLLSGYTPGNGASKSDINFLFSTALSKIAFLPFGYLIDHYRWKVFDGTIKPDELNAGWWSLRHQYQGIVPPDGLKQRADANNIYFDAGSKFHVADNVPYIRYFVSFVIQFQFYQALCDASGHTGPLHQCDFYESKAAGDKLLNLLQLGYSEKWPNAMKEMTGGRIMNASGIMHYFAPLMDYLKTENEAANDCYGWGYQWPLYYDLPMPRCPSEMPSPTSAPGGAAGRIQLAGTLLVVVLMFQRIFRW